MHNCRAFDEEAGTTAPGSSGLSAQGGRGAQGEWGLSGPRGYGPDFPQRPSVVRENVLWNRVTFPQALFESAK